MYTVLAKRSLRVQTTRCLRHCYLAAGFTEHTGARKFWLRSEDYAMKPMSVEQCVSEGLKRSARKSHFRPHQTPRPSTCQQRSAATGTAMSARPAFAKRSGRGA